MLNEEIIYTIAKMKNNNSPEGQISAEDIKYGADLLNAEIVNLI